MNSSWRLVWNSKDQPHTIIRCVLYPYILYRLINIPKWQQVIFLSVCLFFLGGCCCCCLLHFKENCKRNIDLDIGKQVEKSRPWSISILARGNDYSLLILANHTLPFSYIQAFLHLVIWKTVFDSVKDSKRNSSKSSLSLLTVLQANNFHRKLLEAAVPVDYRTSH